MSRRVANAAGWKAVAAIREVQSKAAEMEAMRAAGAHRDTCDRREAAAAAAREAHAGWVEALGGAFDPSLARQWLAHVGQAECREGQASQALASAEAELEARTVERRAAEGRAQLSALRSRQSASAAARQREEARLAEVEDRAARQGRRS